jgi:HEAT repeat protein
MKRSVCILGVLLLLAGCARKPSTTELVAQAKEPDGSTRLQAVRALSTSMKEADAIVPALAEALKDQNHYVRRDAARALRNYGAEARSAVPALLTAARDSDSGVRRAAVDALRDIDPDTAARTLRRRR